MALRFKLIGDHSRGQCCGAAVAEFIRTRLKTAGSLTLDDDYDVLVVNGQGSMHHDAQHCRAKLRALRHAVEAGRRAWLVNTVWQANRQEAGDVLRRVERVVVRECLSQRELRATQGVEAEVCLDFSYFAPAPQAAPRMDFKGDIAITDFYAREFAAHVRITGGELRTFNYISVNDYSWAELIATLKTASLVITGRHQAVYAACKAKVPFVALASDSHKIEGLIEMAGIPIPVCKAPAELAQAMVWARRNEAVYGDLFDWMARQPGWAV